MTAIRVASINLIPPVIVSPPNMSLRELVSIIPGIRSITSPILTILTESAIPILTATMARKPPIRDEATIGMNLFISIFFANSSMYLNNTAIAEDVRASLMLPPKKRVKAKAINIKNSIWW